jgi:ribonuclease J
MGGMGEVGRNMLAVESEGKLLVLDCGLSFPTDEMLGVDLVLPDFSYVAERADVILVAVRQNNTDAVIGALSWFLRDVPVPVFGTALTLGMIRRRLDEHGARADTIEVVAPGERTIGPFRCRFLAVSHSIPDSVAVSVDTQHGRVVYTSDFKLDDNPIDGRRTDVAGFRSLGDEGVDLLLADSTNAERAGRTPSEAIVGDELRRIFGIAERRIVVACFASNLHRIQQVCEAAEEVGRKVACVGRSMVANAEVGRELGHLRIRSDTLFSVDDLDAHAPENTVVLCTGSQGEPFSALSLIAAGDHKRVKVAEGDTVILSAHPIPGNESAVHRVLNGLYRAGAEIYHSGTSPVHVSGHGASDELAEMIRTVRPHHFVPVHGEYRQLALHARLAEREGVPGDRITIVEDGDTLVLEDGRVRRGEAIPHGMVLVDGLGVGDVGPVVLRDRRLLAADGILICVVTIDARNGEILAGPDLISRGFVFEDESRGFLDDAADRVLTALEGLERDGVTDWTTIKKSARSALGEFVWQETRRRPMIMPIVMEV